MDTLTKNQQTVLLEAARVYLTRATTPLDLPAALALEKAGLIRLVWTDAHIGTARAWIPEITAAGMRKAALHLGTVFESNEDDTREIVPPTEDK